MLLCIYKVTSIQLEGETLVRPDVAAYDLKQIYLAVHLQRVLHPLLDTQVYYPGSVLKRGHLLCVEVV